MKKKHARRGVRRGFTLIEALMSATIGFTILGIAMAALYSIGKTYVSTDIRNTVSEDYRDLVRLLEEQGNLSNGFYIYRTFDIVADRDGSTTTNTDGLPDQIGSGNSGDFVLFVYYSMADIKTSPNLQRVSRIVGFYRTQSGSDPTVSQIKWFDSTKHNWGQTFSVSNPATLALDGSGVEALIPKPASSSATDMKAYNSYVSAFPVLTLQTMGIAADDSTNTLRLFYNNNGKSFSVAGMIIRKQTSTGGKAVGFTSQSAFNLTVSPRSAN